MEIAASKGQRVAPTAEARDAGQSARGSLLRNAELLAAVALACVYATIIGGHLQSIDGLLMYRQAQALVYTHQLHFPVPPSNGIISFPLAHLGDNAHATSKYGLGLSLLYVPGLLLWAWAAGHAVALPPLFLQNLQITDPAYPLMCAPVHILVTVLSAYLVARFLLELGFTRATALCGLFLYGLASPAIVYARGDWAQPLAGLCWIAALYLALRFRHSGKLSALLTCAGAVAYAVLTRPVEGTLLVPAVLLLVAPSIQFWRWPRSTWCAAGMVVGGYGAGILVTLAVNWARFGSPFNSGYAGERWTTPLLVGLAGTLVSPGRGIPWEFPAALLAPFGVYTLWPTEHRRVAIALACLAGLQLINVAMWDAWWGGGNWGLRLFVPALPIVAVLAGCGISALPRRIRSAVVGLLFFGGVLWAIPAVAQWGTPPSGTAANFAWSAYAPIGAWNTAGEGADILWYRMAHALGGTAFVVPILLSGAAFVLVVRVVVLTWGAQTTSVTARRQR